MDVAIIQSLVKKGVVDDRVGEYGHLIVDECHHLSAQSFERVARQAKARFVTGLSATIARKDGHHPIILMQCGPVRYRVDAKVQAANRPFEHVVLVQPTSFRPLRAPDTDKRAEFQTLYQELVDDELLPASAIPGWPADVRLPSDPLWKRDYTASVRRLVRDGVDTPLASLFVHVAQTIASDAEGVERARSATERSSSSACRRYPRRRTASASMLICRSPSTVSDDWKLICSAPMRGSQWSLMALNTSPIRSPIDAIAARIRCCRRTATWCCGSSPRTLARSSTSSSTAYCEHSAIGRPRLRTY